MSDVVCDGNNCLVGSTKPLDTRSKTALPPPQPARDTHDRQDAPNDDDCPKPGSRVPTNYARHLIPRRKTNAPSTCYCFP
jgi:hypothetical protein